MHHDDDGTPTLYLFRKDEKGVHYNIFWNRPEDRQRGRYSKNPQKFEKHIWVCAPLEVIAYTGNADWIESVKLGFMDSVAIAPRAVTAEIQGYKLREGYGWVKKLEREGLEMVDFPWTKLAAILNGYFTHEIRCMKSIARAAEYKERSAAI
jgi:hypothetical protein